MTLLEQARSAASPAEVYGEARVAWEALMVSTPSSTSCAC